MTGRSEPVPQPPLAARGSPALAAAGAGPVGDLAEERTLPKPMFKHTPPCSPTVLGHSSSSRHVIFRCPQDADVFDGLPGSRVTLLCLVRNANKQGLPSDPGLPEFGTCQAAGAGAHFALVSGDVDGPHIQTQSGSFPISLLGRKGYELRSSRTEIS
jgi:hypothetical protein